MASLIRVAVLALGGFGCSTGRYAVETDHYRITFPKDWRVVSQARHYSQPTTFLIPAQPEAQTEVRVYAWLERADVANPSSRVLEYLRSEHDADLNLGNVTDSETSPAICGAHSAQVSLLGSANGARYLVANDNWLTVVVGAHAEGSLVGVVGRVPMNDQGCANLAALEQNVQRLSRDLTAVEQPRRLAPVFAFAPMPHSGLQPQLPLNLHE